MKKIYLRIEETANKISSTEFLLLHKHSNESQINAFYKYSNIVFLC